VAWGSNVVSNKQAADAGTFLVRWVSIELHFDEVSRTKSVVAESVYVRDAIELLILRR